MSRRLVSDLLAVVARLRPMADILLTGLAAVFAAESLSILRDEPILKYLLLPLHQVAIVLASFVIPLTLNQYGAYRSQRDVAPTIELLRLWSALTLVVALLVLLAAISKTTDQISRLWSGLWLVYAVFLLSLSRIVVRMLLNRLRRWGYDPKTILLVGNGALAAQIVAQLTFDNAAGYRLIGYLAENPSELAGFGGLAYLGRPDDARQLCLRQKLTVDHVWIAIEEKNLDELRRSISALSELPYELRIIPDGVIATLCEMPTTTSAGMLMVELTGSPMSAFDRIAKALEDRILVVVALIFALPIMGIVAVALKLDGPGPVLFRQKRHGWNGEEITILKFRTMRDHQEPTGTVTQARKDDDRVTRVGRVLRRTSLDELPQLFNVLAGTMSLVGPRPHATEHNELYVHIISNYMHRHRVRPGITGWAQINGYRGETDTPEKMQRRVEYDLYYIEHWSIGFDLVILVLTFVRGLTSPQAY